MSNRLKPLLAVIVAGFVLSSAFPAWAQQEKKDESKGESKGDEHGKAPEGKPGAAAPARPGASGGAAAKPAATGAARPDARGGSGDQARPPHAEAQHHEGDFRDRRDPRAWDDHDRAVWRGGNWHQDWHDGRYGWWWEVAGIWYFYDQPVYPYPLAVSADVDLAPGIGIGVGVATPGFAVMPPPPPPPPVAVIPPPPPPPQPVAAPAPIAAQSASWYYCDNPPGYYPYVQACPAGWRPVPAQTR